MGGKRYDLVFGFYCTLSPEACLEKCEEMHSQLEKYKNMNKNLLSFLDSAKLDSCQGKQSPYSSVGRATDS